MTVLAEVKDAKQFALWRDLGATYTLLWDEGDAYTNDVYVVTDRPLFLVIDRDMTIRYRGSNAEGMLAADAMAVKLLSEK